VAFREYTAQGHLRQPVFVRMRDDKSPEECLGHFDVPPPVDPEATTPGAATPKSSASRSEREPRDLTVSNRDKVFFPERSLTKGDLVDYYASIAPWMLPYLADRPLVLTRFPDGIHGKRFYQRDAPEFVPDWIERQVLWSESAEREVHYFVANDADALVYLANLGTIPIHAWHSRTTDLEHPDWCVLDLDPKGAPFECVVEVALAVRDLAAEISLPAFPKTSGASGLHVLMPLGGRLTHDQAKTLGELLARVIVARLPGISTITRAVRRREGKVYVDYLQNGHGKLLVAPFSARAEPAASVSMPLAWHEVNRKLSNERFTIDNAVRRMRRLKQDPLLEVLRLKPDLHAALAALLELTSSG
jgi:bifunctional non-homologous end joining protein LigD